MGTFFFCFHLHNFFSNKFFFLLINWLKLTHSLIQLLNLQIIPDLILITFKLSLLQNFNFFLNVQNFLIQYFLLNFTIRSRLSENRSIFSSHKITNKQKKS